MRKLSPKARRIIKGILIALPFFLYAILVVQERAFAQNFDIPRITIEPGGGEEDIPLGLQILFLLTILSLAPSILIMMTSFTRIIIVLSLVRNALGTQQLPPNSVLIGLALFLTFFVMAPVARDINDNALQPYLAGDIQLQDGLKISEARIRDFLYKQTRRKDLTLMINLAKIEKPKTKDDVPTYVLIPSFVISELKTAFQMGFVIYIPFLIIDMVVASTLMSMGMLFLPPILISLPFKVLLFVMTDGWHLIVGSLVSSFN
ncbi:flagellar type III secretion system pore protein FliP [bacterium]|nr:flagellar type III secretion system pore protein FliP [bacterium]